MTWLRTSGFRSRPETRDSSLSIARGACYSLYTNVSLRSVVLILRDGASWINLQALDSSSALNGSASHRDAETQRKSGEPAAEPALQPDVPATTAAVDDLTVLRTPRGEWKCHCFRAVAA